MKAGKSPEDDFHFRHLVKISPAHLRAGLFLLSGRFQGINVTKPRSAYIHVPFCAHRCGYCDFTLVAGRDDLADSYLDALDLEIRSTSCCDQLDTLFLGGGTPTQLSVEHLQRLCRILSERFDLGADVEFSVEANPAGLDEDKLAVLEDAGVNRISLGVQSFDDRDLVVLERDHRAADLDACFERVNQRFNNVSLDLIFAVPGQSLTDWQNSLESALRLSPRHVSTYGLTFEKGTTFWSRRNAGTLQQADNDLERDMYAAAIDTLSAAGFEQYEISSFAQPGFQCRHNQVYWTGLPYQGFGPGAASYLDDRRICNHRSTTTWIKRVLNGCTGRAEVEELQPDDRAREFLVLSLRRLEGISAADFHAATGQGLEATAGVELDRLIQQGLLRHDRDRICLSREGLFLFDSIAGELL